MMYCEFKPFATDTELYTKDMIEDAIGDEFEAMMFKGDENIPAYIWTVNYVVIVKRSTKFITDLSFEKIPRNPVCE
ncbi:hypothetical protein [Mesobacillus subterraneus]|uniref:Uncharacterized protein n=1 Tax=Mesobacillus subterraneus TaxID=285983 RepID=A0A427TX83_9BACI|nr:hypothetical protein [Mesobacillus subterraneus]RSD29089.1 hypothetical protein EJA10_02990 [Mesobacillus subterraneus]